MKEKRSYWMEDITEKSKIMVNSTSNTCADTTINSEKLEEVTIFWFFGATLSNVVANTAEVPIRIESSSTSFSHQAQALQVLRSPHPTVRLREMDALS
ncbi:hypothetical protein DPMN_113023 [Dreissena polymorpha]|uniref:Uncharacterized protein n=1 Tax=Dreissena polymorpha TaxID=45954 RepID=A0A9D4KI95_DREPO|nr:hypothetical protein DPMN_113023 [Dreissena polymorpha]